MSIPHPSPDSPLIINALLRQVADDHDSGVTRTAEDYQALFPGYEDTVARALETLSRNEQSAARVMDAPSRVEEARAAGGAPTLGHYRLLREIGRGGQGVVWLAEDTRLGRRVALKTLRGARLADAAACQRFEREARVASSLDEPGICTVYEVGETDGQAWIAMRFLDGESLAALLRRVPRPPDRKAVEARVRIVERVARALQTAHEAGIVHRDLKPGNVILTKDDSPVLVDFGLARGDGETLTAPSELLGTPAYMAPERLDPDGVPEAGIAADIWALGVILYEAVCGRRPFDGPTREALVGAITEREPLSPAACHPAVSKDLATAILTALAKDVPRRYASAAALAEDLRRVLAHEPILARPAGAMTHAVRWVRRNRALAVSLCGFGILLVSALVVALCLLDQRTIALNRAEAAQREERKQRDLAVLREGQTRQVAEFQSKMLSQIDVGKMGRLIKAAYREKVRVALERQSVGVFPARRKRTRDEIDAELEAFDGIVQGADAVDVARQVMDEFLLARAAKELESKFRDQPLVRARLRQALGATYLDLQLGAAAEPHLREALEIYRNEQGVDHTTLLNSVRDLALLLESKGDYAGAEPLYREALAFRKDLGDDNCFVARIVFDLGKLHVLRGDYVAAEPLLSDAVALARRIHGEKSDQVATGNIALSACFEARGNHVEAERLLREAIALRQELHPDDAESAAADWNNLAKLLIRRKQFDAAEEILTRLLPLVPEAYGSEDERTAMLFYNLGELFYERRDYVQAQSLYRDCLEILRRLHGDVHVRVAATLLSLGDCCFRLGDHAAAELHYREDLDIRRKLSAETDPPAASGRLAEALYKQLKYGDAVEMYRSALCNLRPEAEADRNGLALMLHHLADSLHKTGRVEEALEPAQKAVALYRQPPPHALGEHEHAVNILARVLVDSGSPERVAQVRREFVEYCQTSWPNKDVVLAQAWMNLGDELTRRDEHVDAESAYRAAAALRGRTLRPESEDYWRVFSARSCLGDALSAQAAALIDSDAAAAIAKFTEAEPLLVESGRWLVQNLGRVPEASRNRVRVALERTIRLYESWERAAPGGGKAEQAGAWRAEMASLPSSRAAEAGSRPVSASRPSSRPR